MAPLSERIVSIVVKMSINVENRISTFIRESNMKIILMSYQIVKLSTIVEQYFEIHIATILIISFLSFVILE